jgi:hypothetical protein
MVVDDVAKKKAEDQDWLIDKKSRFHLLHLAGNWKPGEIRLKLNRWL